MDHSSQASLVTGRVNQKRRTRDTLVASAAELLHDGKQFSVADVADRAGVGRTTAYRYFPTLDVLVAHAALVNIALLEEHDFDHVFDHPTAHERLDALVAASDRSTHEHETVYRAMLHASLEPTGGSNESLPGRTGFRREVLKRALEPVRKELGAARLERLVGALSLTIGIEALIVTEDAARLSREQAASVKRWTARVLLDAMLEEARQEKTSRSKSSKNGSAGKASSK